MTVVDRSALLDQILRDTGYGERRKGGNTRLEKRELVHLAGWISAVKGKMEAAAPAPQATEPPEADGGNPQAVS